MLNFDRIVKRVHEAGYFDCYVEQTGGGCAAIYAGTRQPDGRYPVIAGPGWFDGPYWTYGHGNPDDFYVGPDDDGLDQPTMPPEFGWTNKTAALEIIRQLEVFDAEHGARR